jgi:hypothetical protein
MLMAMHEITIGILLRMEDNHAIVGHKESEIWNLELLKRTPRLQMVKGQYR